ncbi:uncharacterized protein [Macrobrachium rosenbergii]|uniref:uncharacterized protein n=1 Tax=Macrobrachium rosenbergii TaxID=79674 RepID=UPI0034D68816
MKAANMKMEPDYGEDEFTSPSMKRKHLVRRSKAISSNNYWPTRSTGSSKRSLHKTATQAQQKYKPFHLPLNFSSFSGYSVPPPDISEGLSDSSNQTENTPDSFDIHHDNVCSTSTEAMKSPYICVGHLPIRATTIFQDSLQDSVAPRQTKIVHIHNPRDALENSPTSFQKAVQQYCNVGEELVGVEAHPEQREILETDCGKRATAKIMKEVLAKENECVASPKALSEVPSPDTQSCSAPDNSEKSLPNNFRYSDDSGIEPHFQSYTISREEYEAMENAETVVSTSLQECSPEKEVLCQIYPVKKVVGQDADHHKFNSSPRERVKDTGIKDRVRSSTALRYNASTYESYEDGDTSCKFVNPASCQNEFSYISSNTERLYNELSYFQNYAYNNTIQLLDIPINKSSNNDCSLAGLNTNASTVLLNPITLLAETEECDDEGFPVDDCSKGSVEFSTLDLDMLHDTIKRQIL